jgi:Lon protease-like protein
MTDPALPDAMPVFPLPDTVLFPHVRLPLHIFEPRYRQMIRHVREGDGWLAVALLRRGATEPGRSEAFHDIAGAGRIIQVEDLPDGRFNVLLEGRTRVRLQEIDSQHLYRRVRSDVFPEETEWLGTEEAHDRLRDLLVLATTLDMVEEEETAERFLEDPFACTVLVNRLASVVIADGEERQAMLAARGFRERTRLLRRQLRLSLSVVEALVRHPRPDNLDLN